jgi:hypothetical protein
MNRAEFSWSKAVEFKSSVVTTYALDSSTRPPGLALVKSRKLDLPLSSGLPAAPCFSAAEMRHNFAVWALERDAVSRRRLHLYYCVRCKWAFSVDDRRGSATPVDPNGNPIQAAEAAERLATFSSGPCPAFSRLIENRAFTQTAMPILTFREFFLALLEFWKARFRRWHQSLSPRRKQIHGSAGT